MSTADTCQCVGPFCRCTGSEILKDGHRVSLKGLFHDGAPSNGRIMLTDSEGDAGASDRAYAQMCRDMQTACQEPIRQVCDTAPQTAASQAKEVHDHAYAEARAAGLEDGAARTHAAREAMMHRTANAWRRP